MITIIGVPIIERESSCDCRSLALSALSLRCSENLYKEVRLVYHQENELEQKLFSPSVGTLLGIGLSISSIFSTLQATARLDPVLIK